MSKYNLIDIFEQYKIGSGWTNDFDYDGMLNTGLGTSIDTPIEVLKKIFEDFTDVNYHREAEHLHYAIEAIEIGDMMEAQGKISDFHAEIKKTQGEQGMDMSDDLGAYMASKMEENEAVDLAIEASQEKAGIKEDKYDDIVDADDDIPADEKKAAAAAYRKVDKGASYEKATSHIKEDNIEEMTGEIYNRIDSLIDQKLKMEFIDKFIAIQDDMIEAGDEFDKMDLIDYLATELQKFGARNFEEGTMEENDSIEEALPKFKGVPPMKDIVKALKDDAKATDSEIKQFMASVKKAGDEFDDVDDYVEDFKNYVSDKSLQEHFGRFMKDYQ